jgi:uncharacterized protein (TIGR01777 family)
MKIAVFGGTGFIGTQLVQTLRDRKHEVIVLDLRRDKNWESAIQSVDAVVNLAGTPLFKKRWNVEFQASIYDSRIIGTKKIVEALGKIHSQRGPSGKKMTLINASAIGYYGTSRSETFTEENSAGTDFLAFVCRDWEDAAKTAGLRHGVRTCIVRTGVVLGNGGGALASLKIPFLLFGGGPIDLGREWMSWIHMEDIVGIYVHLLENENCEGIFNGVAPEPVTNKVFSSAFGASLARPSWLPLPSFMLRLIVGEAALVIVNGQKVLPKRTLEAGYVFKHPKVEEALIRIALKEDKAS